MRVGWIGLGAMGAPMARNLLKAGFPLAVATRTPGKAEKFAAENSSLGDVKAVSAPAEVAAVSEVIVTMVTDSPDVVAVARGDHGIFATAKPGSIVIDMSTISPQVTRELAEEARAKGLFWLDAPVSGGEKGAIEGTLTIMVGGDAEALEPVSTFLRLCGSARENELPLRGGSERM